MRVRTLWPAGILLAGLLGSPGPVAAEAAPPVAGVTTIRWTGNARITLTVPRAVEPFTDDLMRLYVTGGSYAFVRMAGPRSADCPAETPRCNFWRLDFLRDLAEEGFPPWGGPGGDHWTYEPPLPPVLLPGPTTFYLFTDGDARFEMRAPGLAGSASYRARRGFHGKAGMLPIHCTLPSSACGPRTDDPFVYGGEAFDLGPAAGAVETVSYTASAAPSLPKPERPQTVRQCLYPAPWDPAASADPADHPYGCDTAPSGTDDAYDAKETAIEVVNFPGLKTALLWVTWIEDATGPRYVGWRAASAGVGGSLRGSFALWYSYE